MAQNRIHFQPGMSMPEFIAQCGTEEQCATALELARWSDGFRCPRCGTGAPCVVQDDRAKRFQCKICRHQAWLTAGTVMEATTLPLTTWFLAIYLLSQAKTGLSGLALMRQLGVCYTTARRIHHKLMDALGEREERYQLRGAARIERAYLGGERSGGKAGRGFENKVSSVAAVPLTEDEHALRVKLTPVSGFTFRALRDWSRQNLAPCCTVYTNGLACFSAVTMVARTRQSNVLGGRKPKDLREFQWINTVLGNLKTSLSGTYHAFAFSKYAARPLAAFAYRFNRRFDPATLPRRLLIAVVHCRRRPEYKLRLAEHAC